MTVKENISVYSCDFCSKKLFVKHAMINHEAKCMNNPENIRQCLRGCKHLTQVQEMVVFEVSGWDGYGSVSTDYKEREVTVFKCLKFEHLMYPFSIERKDLPNRYPATYDNQEPMPKECEGFEEEDYGI